MNASEIQKITGKKSVLALLDRVEKQTENTLDATFNVSFGASFFQGHFPNNPILPGVLIIESLSQACQVLLNDNLQLSHIKKARFREMVRPGDQLQIKVSRKDQNNNFLAAAYVKQKLACSAELSFS